MSLCGTDMAIPSLKLPWQPLDGVLPTNLKLNASCDLRCYCHSRYTHVERIDVAFTNHCHASPEWCSLSAWSRNQGSKFDWQIGEIG